MAEAKHEKLRTVARHLYSHSNFFYAENEIRDFDFYSMGYNNTYGMFISVAESEARKIVYSSVGYVGRIERPTKLIESDYGLPVEFNHRQLAGIESVMQVADTAPYAYANGKDLLIWAPTFGITVPFACRELADQLKGGRLPLSRNLIFVLGAMAAHEKAGFEITVRIENGEHLYVDAKSSLMRIQYIAPFVPVPVPAGDLIYRTPVLDSSITATVKKAPLRKALMLSVAQSRKESVGEYGKRSYTGSFAQLAFHEKHLSIWSMKQPLSDCEDTVEASSTDPHTIKTCATTTATGQTRYVIARLLAAALDMTADRQITLLTGPGGAVTLQLANASFVMLTPTAEE